MKLCYGVFLKYLQIFHYLNDFRGNQHHDFFQTFWYAFKSFKLCLCFMAIITIIIKTRDQQLQFSYQLAEYYNYIITIPFELGVRMYIAQFGLPH